jgi:hypothetical protein
LIGLPAPLERLWPAVRRALPADWQASVAGARPAGSPGRLSARVWRVALQDGRVLSLKLAAPEAPVHREAQVLRWLGARGCAVPTVLAVDHQPAPEWLAVEWCGDETLDERAQGSNRQGGDALDHLGVQLARALASVERAFASLATSRTNALPTLRAQLTPWRDNATETLQWLFGTAWSPEVIRALEDTFSLAEASTPSVGSLDYHAHNVVLDGPRLTMIDFGAVGFDWAARRLAQYAAATGAGRVDGTFLSVLGPAAVTQFADEVARVQGTDALLLAQTVDAHDAVLFLIAAAQLRLVLTGRSHPERATSWRNTESRRLHLQHLLRRSLTTDGPAERLRSLLRRA